MSTFTFKKWPQTTLAALINQLNECRTETSNGKISFTGFQIAALESQIFSSINSPPDTEGEILRKAIFSAINTKGYIDGLSKKNLIYEINKHYNQTLSKQSKKYVLFTGIYLKDELPFSRLRYREVNLISVSDTASKNNSRLIREHNKIVQDQFDLNYDVTKKTSLKLIKVSVNAPNSELACLRALKALDEIRGAIRFLSNNSYTWFSFDAQDRQPFNDIRLNRFISIHCTSNNFKENTLRYYVDWVSPNNLKSVVNHPNQISNFNKIISRLRTDRFPYDHIRKALRMYISAIDTIEPRQSFLELWTVLELITSLGVNITHEDTIKRASSIYNDHDNADLLLRHLREVRNEMVHSEFDSNAREYTILLNQLHRVVTGFIRSCILNPHQFNDINDFSYFYDTLANKGKLTEITTNLEMQNRTIEAIKKFLPPNNK